jgi:hypothetical protein
MSESLLHLGFGVSKNPIFPTLIISLFQPLPVVASEPQTSITRSHFNRKLATTIPTIAKNIMG